MKIKILRYFHITLEMFMTIITILQVPGLDSDIKWRERAFRKVEINKTLRTVGSRVILPAGKIGLTLTFLSPEI